MIAPLHMGHEERVVSCVHSLLVRASRRPAYQGVHFAVQDCASTLNPAVMAPAYNFAFVDQHCSDGNTEFSPSFFVSFKTSHMKSFNILTS